ncbi:hypothetical protein ES288_A05G370200v1 [Gossypium darwinii]|uniref:Uncharacterized protein n=2 Tax=Gossypium TaxID=3633 RepID=A0A5D2QSU1_GOSTO|nr:hypothetical protein ES288_A05G370200v1 [Gossypium darwinii]TYI30274.1 hypothetical protein ES332_A05G374700v1 [Gossypium tomentosum]
MNPSKPFPCPYYERTEKDTFFLPDLEFEPHEQHATGLMARKQYQFSPNRRS